MMKIAKTLSKTFAVSFTSALLITAPTYAKTLTIGIDLSGSNPLLSDPAFAVNAARFAADKVSALKNGDVLQLMRFGARTSTENLQTQRIVISGRNRPKKMAKQVEAYIRTLPKQLNKGQPSTNLVTWLEFTNDFNCNEQSTVLAITDGLESSSVISAKAFITGSKSLPTPDVDLTGCKVIFYGLGAGLEFTAIKHIRKGWTDYLGKSGAEFSYIAP